MKVWFNKGLSNTFDALEIIRSADLSKRIALLASHTDGWSPVSKVADQFFVEPRSLCDGAYVDWCLAQCVEQGVDVFVPQRRREAISGHRERFDAQGVRLSVMAGPQTVRLVDRKHELYDDLRGSDVPVPPYRVFRTADEFDQAVMELEATNRCLCVKPSVGVYGAGFRILERDGCELKRILSGDNLRTSFNAFRSALLSSAQERDLMLMAYLPGIERSVDVLAQHGRMVSAVSRVKVGSHQILETDGLSITIAEMLTERYRLDGMFNVQTKESEDGTPYLLEINSRMSGGLIYSCQAGVAFPYWAIMLAAGEATPEDVPIPTPGLRIAPVQGCLRL